MRRLLAGIALAVLAPADAAATTYLVDPDASRILVHTDRGGLFGFAGHRHVIRVDDYSGRLEWTEDGAGGLDLAIVAASLTVADDDLDEDKIAQVQAEMERAVLEIDEYPQITFRSTSVERLDEDRFKVKGELDLHGVTRGMEFPVTIVEENGRVHLEAEIEVKQKDHDIDPVSVGLGAVKVKNEVKLSFSLAYVAEVEETK